MILALVRAALVALTVVVVVAAGAALAALAYLRPKIPDIGDIEHVRLQVPLRVLSAEGELIGEFGEQRRIPVGYDEVPPVLVQAILAAEDDRFFAHPGVDSAGLLRAALAYARTGTRRQGGSTITMQVARNFFLTRDKTIQRKVLEILLALEIEQRLSKQEILELYINKIFLGHRAYGFAAAAQVYYAKELAQLTLDEAATLAGLPKAPSRDNPLAAPDRARQRRDYVLRRMAELDMITPAQARAAMARPIRTARRPMRAYAGAPYAAEMARRWMLGRFGEDAYLGGYVVHTTLRAKAQRVAQHAVRQGLEAYDARKSWRGPEARLPADALRDPEALEQALGEYRTVGGLRAAAVVGRRGEGVELRLADGRSVVLDVTALRRAGDGAARLAAGDVVRLARVEKTWRLAQVPEIEGALVALVPRSGAIVAVVGGYDFRKSAFNRAVQADRQPGSAFKPFIYAAALGAGYTPATVVNDAPVVYRADTLAGYWKPGNYSGQFYGPTRLREALAHSRNLVSVRLLDQIGVAYGRNYTLRFGFPPDKVPNALSLALGTGAMTPLELAAGYAVIANGGYLVEPYLVDRVQDASGAAVYRAGRTVSCDVDCPEDTEVRIARRVIPATDAYLLYSMLQEVIRSGTGRAAQALGRADLAGKTGTTNDFHDAWFAGFSPDLLAVAWAGFDQPRSLGERETGGRVALPMWSEFMRSALSDIPERSPVAPEGIVTLRVDRDTGAQADAGDPDAVVEVFDERNLPSAGAFVGYGESGRPAQPEVPADLF